MWFRNYSVFKIITFCAHSTITCDFDTTHFETAITFVMEGDKT